MTHVGTANSISRRGFLRVAGSAAALTAGAGLWAAEGVGAKRPLNLVFILADDLGWRDTTLYGSTFYETPNLERLARRGMIFTQAYAASPLCSPTRASILTGLWPARIGITAPVCHLKEELFAPSVAEKAPAQRKVISTQSATRLKQEYVTLAETLQGAGYRTGHFGKWHLGPEPYDPLHQGFDVDIPHYPGPGPAGSYVAPWKFPAALQFSGQPGEHIEDRMAREAVAFIGENKDRPFFLNYWCFSVHSPWDGKQELIDKYARKADPKSGQRHPVYGAMVQSMDEAVGALLDALDANGLADNTLIVFFSDNGGYAWEARNRADLAGVPVTSNAPLRGGKATLYEGGTREPCIVVWPGQVAPGTKSDALIQSIDFCPTLLEMLALQPAPGQRFDGISIVPALRGQPLQREALFCYFPHEIPGEIGTKPGVWVRQGDWKLIRHFFDGPTQTHAYELYNLKDDLSETTNLAAQEAERVKALDALIDGFLAETKPLLPRPNPAYDPAALLLDGWWAVRGGSATVRDGWLVFDATGGLCTLAVMGLPAATGDITLSFRMRSTASGPVNAFWNNPGEGSFKPERAVLVPFAHDGQWHDVSVRLPLKGTLNGIRLDPANARGRVEIDWVRALSQDGKTLREWEFGPRDGLTR
jgi:arylsulfatase A-like enzyme